MPSMPDTLFADGLKSRYIQGGYCRERLMGLPQQNVCGDSQYLQLNIMLMLCIP